MPVSRLENGKKQDDAKGKDGVGKLERMALAKDQAEIRLAGDDDDRKIVGYASVFYDGTNKTEYELWEDMVERIMPGAFDEALAKRDDVRGLFNHDPDNILGRTSAGTMELRTDKKGLWYEIEPGDTTIARDVVASIERGDIDGSSFAFRVVSEEVRKEDDVYIREITKVRLFDVGPVTFPAYTAATSDYREKEEVACEVRDRVSFTEASDGELHNAVFGPPNGSGEKPAAEQRDGTPAVRGVDDPETVEWNKRVDDLEASLTPGE